MDSIFVIVMDVLNKQNYKKMQCLRHEVTKMSPFQASVCHINEAAGGNAMTTSRNRKKTSKKNSRSIEFQKNPSNSTQLRHVDTFWLFDFCEMWIFIWKFWFCIEDLSMSWGIMILASSLGAQLELEAAEPLAKTNIISFAMHEMCYKNLRNGFSYSTW